METRRTNGYWKIPDKSKPKPDPAKVKELAATGLTRTQAAKSLGIKYARLCYLITTYNTFAVAWADGEKEHKDKNTCQ